MWVAKGRDLTLNVPYVLRYSFLTFLTRFLRDFHSLFLFTKVKIVLKENLQNFISPISQKIYVHFLCILLVHPYVCVYMYLPICEKL